MNVKNANFRACKSHILVKISQKNEIFTRMCFFKCEIFMKTKKFLELSANNKDKKPLILVKEKSPKSIKKSM